MILFWMMPYLEFVLWLKQILKVNHLPKALKLPRFEANINGV